MPASCARPLNMPNGPDADRGYAQPARQRTVLIIDDDRAIRDSLCMALIDEGLDCLAAANGAEGIDRLREADRLPDLVMLDLMMPVMSGWEFRVRQLSDPRLADIPTLILTATGDTAAHVGELRAQGVLRKPFDLDTLLDAIACHLPGWRPSGG